ncbi:MAG: hypothetical protein RR461_10930, partial [Angelakisella sp.]
MTLSKREKRLLYCLGCVVIVAIGMYLFIFPAMNTYAALSEQLSALGAQQMTRAEAIANMNGLDADVRDMKKDIERIRARYDSSMFSETLDRQITNLLRQHNGRPVSLILGEPAEITVSPYGNSADTASDPSETDEFVSLADYMAVIDSAKN